MIWVTGDTHACFERLSTKNFPEQKEMTKDDYVIVLGDFGGIWDYQTSGKTELYWLNWLEDKPFTTLFIDGNHENYDRLYAYPVKEWNGGLVHEIRPSIFHLMRGQVFILQDKAFFTFGGASSHDISDGILEFDDPRLKDWRRIGKMFRVNHFSWWERELPSEEERQEGIKNLEECGNKVDFVLTHCTASSTQAVLSQGFYKPDALTDYLEDIKCKTEYDYWLFGHYHVNQNVTTKDICMYEQIVRLV